MKNILTKVLLVGAVSFAGLSCSDDVLDRKPLDQISPDKYYKTAEQLSSFTINYYSVFAGNINGYVGNYIRWDDGTDNQASSGGANEAMFSRGIWLLPAGGGLDFNAIRNINYFINDVEAKLKVNGITGAPEDINHYLGEAYFFRAFLYFGKLQAYGDYPIVTEVLTDDEASLKEHAKRQARNKVAKFILADLDKAAELLKASYNKNQRLTKNVAQLLKSRVALYEATFEMYHKGSGRVPGDPTWPGKDKEWNRGEDFSNQDASVRFFLEEAVKSADIVAKAIELTPNTKVTNPTSSPSGWNPYFEMFASNDPSVFPEVMLWRQHSKAVRIMQHTSNRIVNGTGTGWTRGLVESFLTKDGKPYYAVASTRSDATIKAVKENRDNRLQLFVFAEDDVLKLPDTKFSTALLLDATEVRESTGYRQRKGLNYDPSIYTSGSPNEESGTVLFRASEAYLNYIEASYLLNKSLTAEARAYWEKLRVRAGIDPNTIDATISATNMAQEANVNRPSYDWAAFSAGVAVDPTLYSIRRERRCEFAGEGMRMADLKRWRALDQVSNYQLEGVNFWESLYDHKDFKKVENNVVTNVSRIVSDGSAQANVSDKALSKYLRPYQRVKTNNRMFDGYTFPSQAHYLSPFSLTEMQLCSPTGNAAESNLYQNPGWGIVAAQPAQ